MKYRVEIFDSDFSTYAQYRYMLRVYEQWCSENLNQIDWKIENINVFIFKNEYDSEIFKIRIDI